MSKLEVLEVSLEVIETRELASFSAVLVDSCKKDCIDSIQSLITLNLYYE